MDPWSSASSIGWGGLVASLVLVAVALAVSWRMKLGLERSMVWSCARAGVQLLAHRVGADARAPSPGLRRLVVGSGSWRWCSSPRSPCGTGPATCRPSSRWRSSPPPWSGRSSLGVIFGFHIFPVEAHGHPPRRDDDRQLHDLDRGRGPARHRRAVATSGSRSRPASRSGCRGSEASRPYLREAMRTAMIPQIESTKAVGLVVPAGRHDRPHPRRGEPGRRRAGPAGHHVPDPRVGGHQRHAWPSA